MHHISHGSPVIGEHSKNMDLMQSPRNVGCGGCSTSRHWRQLASLASLGRRWDRRRYIGQYRSVDACRLQLMFMPRIAPMIFSACVAIANYAIYMSTIDYMVASYGIYSASATGGNGFARDFLAGVAAMYASVSNIHRSQAMSNTKEVSRSTRTSAASCIWSTPAPYSRALQSSLLFQYTSAIGKVQLSGSGASLP